MKIVFPCHDHNFKLGMESGAINGGTATLFHYAEAFKKLDWEAELCEYSDPLPEADVYMCQSEWYAAQIDFFKKKRAEGKKIICWLGHWIGGAGYPYYDPKLIEADLFITTWKGEVVEKYEKETGKKVYYIPHAFGEDLGELRENVERDCVFTGNTYALRNEGIIENINVTRLAGIHPAEIPAHYRLARICLNFHGRFQQGDVSKEPSTLANEPGFALNERTFQVSGAGGFQMCQQHPLLKDIFTDEIVTFTDNKDLKEKIAYWLPREKERKEMAEKAKKVILENHTYLHRAKEIIYLLEKL